MEDKEISNLRDRVYNISNSMLPLNTFFNDIRDNTNPNFNKEAAYKDLEIIVERFEESRSRLKKLEKVVEIFKTKYIPTYIFKISKTWSDYIDYLNLEHECSIDEMLTFAEYELLKEVLDDGE